MSELQPQFNKPELPAKWNYQESVNKVKSLIFKWKTLTEELFNELEIARDKINEQFQEFQKGGGTFVPPPPTWSRYCKDIGNSRRSVNRWLRNWQELKKRIQIDPPWPIQKIERYERPYTDDSLLITREDESMEVSLNTLRRFWDENF